MKRRFKIGTAVRLKCGLGIKGRRGISRVDGYANNFEAVLVYPALAGFRAWNVRDLERVQTSPSRSVAND